MKRNRSSLVVIIIIFVNIDRVPCVRIIVASHATQQNTTLKCLSSHRRRAKYDLLLPAHRNRKLHDRWPTGSSIGGVIVRLRVARLVVLGTSDELPATTDRQLH